MIPKACKHCLKRFADRVKFEHCSYCEEPACPFCMIENPTNIVDSEGNEIASCYGHACKRGRFEAIENARIMAEAKEFYRLARAIVFRVETVPEDRWIADEMLSAINRIRGFE